MSLDEEEDKKKWEPSMISHRRQTHDSHSLLGFTFKMLMELESMQM